METKSPLETLDFTSDLGVTKANRKVYQQFILAFFAGCFIAFGAEGSNMAVCNLLGSAASYGVGKALQGLVFGVGLMLVLIAGAELFTGNCLMFVSVLDKKLKMRKMLLSWLIVYVGNWVGGVFIAWLMAQSGLFSSAGGALASLTINIAYGKVNLHFWPAFVMGILCNWLVCLAVWVSFSTKDAIAKMFACTFIIGLFVCSGFEHSVANMYYIASGLFAKGNPAWVNAWLAAKAGRTPDMLNALNWGTFFYKNLLPVTLGNIVGGSGFVGLLYWWGLRSRAKKAA
jgi:formate/nitrite transporter